VIIARVAAALLVLGALGGTTACGDDAAEPATTVSSRVPTPSPTQTTNGIDTLAPAEAMQRVRTAFLEAPTIRMHGAIGDGLSLDYRTTANGDAQGSLRLDGMRMDFIVIGTDVWLSGDRAFWAEKVRRKKAPAVLTGKYMRTTLSSKAADDLRFFAARAEFTSMLPTDVLPVGQERVNGAAAYRFRDPDDGTEFLVALTGKPYPLEMSLDDPKDPAMVRFVYDKPVTLEPPAAEDVVGVIR
jgi:hypothetical protein